MSRTWPWARLAGTMAFVWVISGCAAGVSTPSASGVGTPIPGRPNSAGSPDSITAAPQPSSSFVSGDLTGAVVFLADGVGGSVGLWILEGGSKWTQLAATPGATALSRAPNGIAVATAHDVDVRSVSALTQPGKVVSVHWPGTEPAAQIGGMDMSASGRVAIVLADDGGVDYAVAGADGMAAPLSPAPVQTFTPIVAWLDDARLLVLNTDVQQRSRLAVLDTTAHSMSVATGLSGVRVFAISGDGQTVVAATEGDVFAGPLGAFQAAGSLQPVARLAPAQVVWALAVDPTGAQVFMLTGTEGPDGTVGAVRELVYRRTSSGWAGVLDLAATFTRGLAQVYLP